MIKNKNRGHSMTGMDITIRGLVQGIGFRPFIYRLAHEHDLTGWVKNTNEAVKIKIEGKTENCNQFIEAIHSQKPWTATYLSVINKDSKPVGSKSFIIESSEDVSDKITRVSPDIAVCEECLNDLKKAPHRINYPLVNCTYCGPRFSIIKSLPYDRVHTTMAEFKLCDQCQVEYQNVWDRRFHAQPIACNHCGPHYELWTATGLITNINEIIRQIVDIIDNGGVLAMKGTGGFHLVCDAHQENAVHKLRTIKKRDQKPFAVMVQDIKSLSDLTYVSENERKILTDWKRPIVLLNLKKAVISGINDGLNTLGVMLPYMPLHYLLFENLSTSALVMTSGNITDEPIVIDNQSAQEKFGDQVEGLVDYNREIHNRIDDSVVTVVRDQQRLIRRARGFVPMPIQVPFDVDNILATGAELTNCFALGKGNEVIISQHIGDLKDYETYTFYTETIEKFKSLFRVNPQLVAVDKHPDYLASQYGRELDIPIINVQHHHAHIAACMAEHQLTEPVLGVCFDGTGLGEDGHSWGGEFMYADYQSFERYLHFNYVPLPGGDKAIKEPWRIAVAYLYQIYGRNVTELKLPFLNNIQPDHFNMIVDMLEQNLNTPLSSGVGRLFDTVAALTGTCLLSDFHAQAPMLLEAMVDEMIETTYPFDINKTIQVKTIITGIVEDLLNNIPIPVIATKFHNTLVSIILYCIKEMMKRYTNRTVVLSGGVFQNAYLLDKTEAELEKLNIDVYSPLQVPCNDGGIALGQIAIAANHRKIINNK